MNLRNFKKSQLSEIKEDEQLSDAQENTNIGWWKWQGL